MNNLKKYRIWQSQLKSQQSKQSVDAENHLKNERSESGFDEMLNSNNSHHILNLNIPLPPSREPPRPPIETDFSPQQSPLPCRMIEKQPIPGINLIQSTPSPTLKGNHKNGNDDNDENIHLIESNRCDDGDGDENNQQEGEIKIDELHVEVSDLNVRKGGIISEKIKHEELEDFEMKVYPKDRR